jgi:hypothetical protein
MCVALETEENTLVDLEDYKKPSSCHICQYTMAIRTLHAGKGTLQKQVPAHLLLQV